jgi:excisionase family DNA binding protein
MSEAVEPVSMTIKQACAYVNLSRQTIGRLRKAKKLTDQNVGSRVLLLVSELKKLVGGE